MTLSRPLAVRFWEKVDKDADGDCWLWTAAKNAYGYGSIGLGPGRGTALAHRVSYMLEHGALPDDLTIDHLCMVRACVNPAHLEAVPFAVNHRRALDAKPHCKHGHEWTPENTFWRKDRPGHRICRTCARRNGRASYRRLHPIADST